MAEHWCKDHKTVWFPTKYGYGHPIVDEEGNPVLNDDGKPKWCREPKEKAEKSQAESPERQASIEVQNAYTGVPGIVRLKQEFPNDLLVSAAYNYAMSKLSRWASMGTVTREPQSTQGRQAKQGTIKEQVTELAEQVKEKLEKEDSIIDLPWLKKSLTTLRDKNLKGWSESELLSYMKGLYKVDGETVLEIAAKLGKGAANHFVKNIQDALSKGD